MNKPVFHRVVALDKNASLSGFPQNYGFIYLYLLRCLELSQRGEFKNSRLARNTCLCRVHVMPKGGEKYTYNMYTRILDIRKTSATFSGLFIKTGSRDNFFIRNGGLREWGKCWVRKKG